MNEGLILHRYRPLGTLGSRGSVTLAFDTRMARRVAIKRIPLPRDSSSTAASKAGLAEARTAALLNHPNIVTVHEWDTSEGEAFIVMEDVGGASLDEILDGARAALSLDVATAIIEPLVTALAFAHENGVLHLDLKPANALVTRDGRVKLADFGVSALTRTDGRALATAGTIGYMPPEQMRGEALDERTDMWALAALAYEVLTGANPFDADTIEGSLYRIEVADVPLPSEFVSSLPEGVDDVLMAALAPDPEDRYLSVTGFGAALAPYLGSAMTGRGVLAEMVEKVIGPASDEYRLATEPGLWDRAAAHSTAIRRVLAAGVCAWLAWSGVTAFPLDTPVIASVAALVGLAGLLAPGLALALGLGTLTVGLLRAAGVLPATVAGLVVVSFWLLHGRRGTGPGLAPWATPFLGLVHAAPAAPLLLGFVYPPLTAALSATLAGSILMVTSFVAGRSSPLLVVPLAEIIAPLAGVAEKTVDLSQVPGPGILVALAAWPLSAAICSFACGRSRRSWAAVGALLGALVWAGGYYLWAAELGGSFTLSDLVPDGPIALAVVAVAIALGPPPNRERAPSAE